MLDLRTSTHLTWLALAAMGASEVSADPSQTSLLSPVFALSGRSSDPEHMVNPFEVAAVATVPAPSPIEPAPSREDSDDFASADSGIATGGETSPERIESGDELNFVSYNSEDAFASYPGDLPGESTGVSFHDFEDTLIRSEQDSRVQTFVGEGGERLPESWAVPPGGSVPGGYPGYRRESSPVDYTGNPEGVAYFPPPSYGDRTPGSSYNYPSYGYHPGGPYAYRYDGMDPMGDPGFQNEANYEFEGDIPLFTHQFNPDDAHLKVGPLYFQALWVETGVLYSDYHGPTVFAPGEEDGWLSYASFRFRLAGKITPSLYFTADGELIYLFQDNELGFKSGFGSGPFARLSYETELNGWDFEAYAEFGTGSFYDAFGAEAFEQAGRYSFGYYGQYDSDGLLYDPYLYTRVGVEASKPVNPDWEVRLLADHTDYWYIGDERAEEHYAREHFSARYEAIPGQVPFSPWFSYDLYSDDYFDTAYHTVYTGGSGRLSENVFLDARFGYFWTTNDVQENQHWLWNIGLRHRINERTTHGVNFGQDFFMSDFSIDSTVSNFVQYYITHQLTERVQLYGFAQWSKDEFLSGQYVGGEYDSEMLGARVSIAVSDRVTTDFGYWIENRNGSNGAGDFDREIFDANLNVRIGQLTSSYLRYQHEDTDLYYEDLYMAGIRRSF